MNSPSKSTECVAIILDTETGGLWPNSHPLLEIGCCIMDSKGTVREAYEKLIEYPEPLPNMTGFALRMNSYLERLDAAKEAGAGFGGPKEVAKEFFTWMNEMTEKYPNYVLVGQNLDFDLDFVGALLQKYMKITNWGGLFNRNITRDTKEMVKLLMDAGRLPGLTNSKWDVVLPYFGDQLVPPVDTVRHAGAHTALYDAIVGGMFYLLLVRIASNGKAVTQ